MTKKFGMLVSMAVAVLVAGGNVAAIGANNTQEVQSATSVHIIQKDSKQEARQVATKAAQKAAKQVLAEQKTDATPQVASNNQSMVAPKATTAVKSQKHVATAATQPTTTPVVDQTVQAATANVATKGTTTAPVYQTAFPVTNAPKQVVDQSQQPAVEPRTDAQGQATSAAMAYARQKGMDFSGLQVGTTPSANGGYDVLIRNKRLAEQGQGNGVQQQLHVDASGKVTSQVK